MTPDHVLVLGDQLTDQVGPLSRAEPGRTTVLMIESRAIAGERSHHKKKLGLVFSAMRHFAASLRSRGFDVVYLQSSDFASGVVEFLSRHPGASIDLMSPTDWGVCEEIVDAADRAGGAIKVVPNELWLTSDEEFDLWATGRTSLRLEYFYRAVRATRGWLMDGDRPAGGSWNYDAENRKVPKAGHRFPPVIRFEPDDVTRAVLQEVDEAWPGHFGETKDFDWPVTRAQALEALDDFLIHRLPVFGPFEDAMVDGEDVLYHSLLSVPLNLGLLHPLEVCQRALERAADPANGIGLASIEGFIRQILGWREFVRHVYRTSMPGLREANGLRAERPLPDFYWSGDTQMHCLHRCVDQVSRSGHAHHIQRLMVLGNFSLVAGIDPGELNDWFLATFVDALDWVVTPNVMGMSQFADLGSFTSKPYAASGKYIDRMGDYCASCVYDVKSVDSGDSCPFNSLYWSFIDRHQDRWVANQRMAMITRGWAKRDPEVKRRILARADEVLDRLSHDEL
ncbi:MAG: cryptochrome/photolyase family protein [Longimicrobiales bacterium]